MMMEVMGCKSHDITHSTCTCRYELARVLDAMKRRGKCTCRYKHSYSGFGWGLPKAKLIHLLSNHSLLLLVKYSPWLEF